MKIIDGRVRLRTEILLRQWDASLHPHIKDYIEKYDMQERLSVMEVDELLNHASAFEIEKMLVYGSTPEENSHMLELARKHSALIPVGGVSLAGGIKSALQEISRLKAEGAVAINFSIFDNKNVNDRDFYALYGYCELNSIPVIIHSAIQYSRETYMWLAQPQHFDEIAVDFPELKVIMSHGGNGFGPATLAVAQRHPNLYLEFSALRPKYMAPEFIQAANTYLKDRCIFGTDYPLTDFDHQIKLWKYSLREEVWEQFFNKNIQSALFGKPIAK